jgi:hypothetical protein
MKKELQADAEHDWKNGLVIKQNWKLFEINNDIDNYNTSKQNNDISDNNEGGTQ